MTYLQTYELITKNNYWTCHMSQRKRIMQYHSGQRPQPKRLTAGVPVKSKVNNFNLIINSDRIITKLDQGFG